MKPHIARELAALNSAAERDDETIFRRAASEVMVQFARAVMTENHIEAAHLVRLLKRVAIDLDQPAKVELVFDVIAALEIASSPKRI
jgi:hypothetical protein